MRVFCTPFLVYDGTYLWLTAGRGWAQHWLHWRGKGAARWRSSSDQTDSPFVHMKDKVDYELCLRAMACQSCPLLTDEDIYQDALHLSIFSLHQSSAFLRLVSWLGCTKTSTVVTRIEELVLKSWRKSRSYSLPVPCRRVRCLSTCDLGRVENVKGIIVELRRWNPSRLSTRWGLVSWHLIEVRKVDAGVRAYRPSRCRGTCKCNIWEFDLDRSPKEWRV